MHPDGLFVSVGYFCGCNHKHFYPLHLSHDGFESIGLISSLYKVLEVRTHGEFKVVLSEQRGNILIHVGMLWLSLHIQAW